jgi:hypothetical protein
VLKKSLWITALKVMGVLSFTIVMVSAVIILMSDYWKYSIFGLSLLQKTYIAAGLGILNVISLPFILKVWDKNNTPQEESS